MVIISVKSQAGIRHRKSSCLKLGVGVIGDGMTQIRSSWNVSHDQD